MPSWDGNGAGCPRAARPSLNQSPAGRSASADTRSRRAARSTSRTPKAISVARCSTNPGCGTSGLSQRKGLPSSGRDAPRRATDTLGTEPAEAHLVGRPLGPSVLFRNLLVEYPKRQNVQDECPEQHGDLQGDRRACQTGRPARRQLAAQSATAVYPGNRDDSRRVAPESAAHPCRDVPRHWSERDRSWVACGYNSTSAFIAAFKNQLGMTPRRYCARSGSRETE